MQPQTEIHDGANGETAVLAGAEARKAKELEPYYFDKTPLDVDVPWAEGVTLKVYYSKPAFEDHETYEASVIRREVVDSDGEVTDESSTEEANVEFFDSLVEEAEKYREGEDKPFETWSADRCLSLPAEVKSNIVALMGKSKWEIANEDDDEAMFSPDGIIEIIQRLDKHVITYKLKVMDRTKRRDFESGIKSKEKTKKNKTIKTTEVKLLGKAKKHFAAHFLGVTGGRLEAGEYTPERRDDFLGQIDSGWQFLVMNKVVNYFKRGRD